MFEAMRTLLTVLVYVLLAQLFFGAVGLFAMKAGEEGLRPILNANGIAAAVLFVIAVAIDLKTRHRRS